MKKIIDHTFFNLGLLSTFALLVLIYRIQLSDNNDFIFLVWNLFLAWIPYLATHNVERTSSRWIIAVKLFLWLLFLPNAPYMITDMLHLHPRSEAPYWLDTFILFLFSITGILLFYVSSRNVWTYFANINGILAALIMPLAFALCGYGVFLGRWLRFNSWDAFNHPLRLSRSIFHSSTNWSQLSFVLTFSLLFGLALFIIFRTLRSLNT